MNRQKDCAQIDKLCRYCENAAELHDADHMLCSRAGVVRADHVCRRFSYDPLKRKPAPARNAPDGSDNAGLADGL